MKKILNIGIVLIISLIIITGCSFNKQTKKINKNKGIVKNQIVDNLNIENTSLTVENGLSKFQTQVTNNTDKDYELKEFKIIIKDKKGKVIETIPGNVGEIIKSKETKTINTSINIDLKNAYTVEYKIIK